MKKLLVILGPTATGKTDLALRLAHKFNGELIACDSRQVYKGLDVGTGKLPNGEWTIDNGQLKKGKGWWEINGVKIWMYDVTDLNSQYTVADYQKDAEKVIEDILKRGKLPIIVGGTGLYLKALLEGLPNLSVPINKKLRKELELLSVEELQQKLKILSPTKFRHLNDSDKQNPRRLLRSIELVIMNPYVRKSQKSKVKSQNFNYLKIGLTAPREILYKNSDSRILNWFDQGIIEEVEKLIRKGVKLERFKQLGLEYGLIAEYIDAGKKDLLDSLITKMEHKLHGYVRRQLTWYKKEQEVIWFDITKKNFAARLEKRIARWYD